MTAQAALDQHVTTTPLVIGYRIRRFELPRINEYFPGYFLGD
jgi:hypothetical protein